MKISATIFILVLSFLTVQPLFSSMHHVEKKTCCMKQKMDCPREKQQSGNAGQCDNNKCNPFMACSSGNFYIAVEGVIESHINTIKSKKILAFDDNRLASCLSDSWHPPELTQV